MASHKAAHSRSRKGNDTNAESFGEPQTPAELPQSSIHACLGKRVILSPRGFPLNSSGFLAALVDIAPREKIAQLPHA